MIHYHGGPITPYSAALHLWRRGHAMVSFAYPDQLPLAAEVAQSFVLDNGAFTLWKAGRGEVDVSAYSRFADEWISHPGFDWCLIPDKIDGTEDENDELIKQWRLPKWASVPVWHLHESLERLQSLMEFWPRIALGSSGEYADPGSDRWWTRIAEAMEIACFRDGRPKVKLHGLRMLDPTIFSHIPLSSADSTNGGQNVGIDKKWTGPYQPMTKDQRAAVLGDRIEFHASAAFWSGTGGIQKNLGLIG